VAAAIRLHEEELRLIEAETMPVELRAPISGMIGEVFRENGEAIVDGEPILTIRSDRPEYVVGYMPHPLRMDPGEGMPVLIRSQGNRQRQYNGRIVQVGAQLEDMTEAQVLVTNLIRMALPIQIAVDDGFSLRPGEIVNVTITGHSDRAVPFWRRAFGRAS
jgi:multidrug resistance efflux pump